jgi:prostaglandin-E synthase
MFPNLKWAQRMDTVYLTIDILDAEKTEINLTDEGKLSFSAESHGQKYGFDMELYKGVIKEESGWNTKGRNVSFRLAKTEEDQEEYWPRLTKDKIKN